MKKETVLPSRRKWYLLAGTAWIMIILSLVSLCFVIWNRYKKAIFQAQESQMLVTVQSMSNIMKNTLDSYASDILGLSRTAFYEDGKINTEVLEEYSANREFLDNLILTDDQDRIVWEKKEEQFPDEYGSSVMADGAVSFRVCGDSSGRLQFLFSRKLDRGGSLCSVMSVDRYYGMFSKIQVGSAGYIILKSSDGILLMHPDPSEIGINVISGRKQQHPDLDLSSLETMVEKQKRGETGTADYYSYWWTDAAVPRVRKIAAYTPVSIGTDFLILSMDMDYNDILKPMSRGFSGIVAIMTAILAVICVFLAFVYILALKDRKNREEIQYLRNLNEVLEKTHQGEEALAHQQRLQIMGTMTGGIVHEFNNLLTPIMGYADMLMSSLPEKSDDYDSAREIFEASEKAEDIIRQISSLSRKNIETAFHYIDAEQFIRRSVKMIRTICPYYIRIEETITTEGAGFLGNKTQMNQVLLNLCVNAFHAIGDTQDGKVVIQAEKVGQNCLQEDGIENASVVFDSYIRIRVCDNGCGMDPVTQEQIFQPFFTTRPAGQGTGLGLAVVDQIIHSHKGEISVKSKKGAGSVFAIYLPVSEKNVELDAGDAKEAGISPKFMLIEPNLKILQILGHDFSKIGIKTVSVERLDQAEKLLREEKPDVLILETAFTASGSDCMGIDFAMTVMEKYTGMIRIVMVDKIRKEIVEAKQKGIIDDYIEKPVSVSSILDAVRRIHTTVHGTEQDTGKAGR